MRIELLGERSIIIRDLPVAPIVAASMFKDNLEGVQDASPCYDTVGLYFCENVPNEAELERSLEGAGVPEEPAIHLIPVCYDLGLDLEEAASQLGISSESLVSHHVSKPYSCAAIGFVPGFAYLGELDPAISGLGRLPTPRNRVEAGSVAITGKQTAVYPSSTPGGWWIIGKTPLNLVEEVDGYFPISPGDSVEFYRIDLTRFKQLEGERL